MPAFIDHIAQSMTLDDKKPVQSAIQRTISRIATIELQKNEGGRSYGELCRIFDSVPLTLQQQRMKALQKKYLELMTLAAQKLPQGQKNTHLKAKAQEFTRELLKDCSHEILNPKGELHADLVKVLNLDAVEIEPTLKLKALVFAFVHHLQMGISESIRDVLITKAAANNGISITKENPLENIMAAMNLPSGNAAWKTIEKDTEIQRLIDKEITEILNIIQSQYQNMNAYINVHNNNILFFMQNYVQSGHSSDWNKDFIQVFHDPEIMLTVTPRLSIFKLDRVVTGDVILQYIAKRYPEEAANVIRQMAEDTKEMKDSQRERLASLIKLIPAAAQEIKLSTASKPNM